MVQSNTIRSTAGLERLSALEELDLACNLLASVHEVARISGAGHAEARDRNLGNRDGIPTPIPDPMQKLSSWLSKAEEPVILQAAAALKASPVLMLCLV